MLLIAFAQTLLPKKIHLWFDLRELFNPMFGRLSPSWQSTHTLSRSLSAFGGDSMRVVTI